jgi:hypothetical protein
MASHGWERTGEGEAIQHMINVGVENVCDFLSSFS